MKASTWLLAALAVGGGSLILLGGAAFGPLVLDAATAGPAEVQADHHLCCLMLPPHASEGTHLAAYALLGLLLLGAGAGIVTFARQVWRTRRVLRQLLRLSRPLDPPLQTCLTRLHLAGRVDLIQTAIPLAFCYGLLYPRVCISTGMVALLAPDELAALLWHERYHMLQRDPLRIALGRAWAATFFFLPLVQVLYQRYLLVKEIDADAYTCAQQGDQRSLAGALYVLRDLRGPGAGSAFLGVSAAGATDALEARISRLEGQAPLLPLSLRSVTSSGLLLLLIIGGHWGVSQASMAATLWHATHTLLCSC